MAKSPEEQNIKSKARRRLIGAVALTLAVVVILPMVLDSEPRVTGKDIDLRIPAPDKVGEFAPGAAVSEVTEASTQAETVASQVSAVSEAPVVAEPVQKAVVTGKVTKPEVAVPEVRTADATEAVTVKPAEAKSRPTEDRADTKKPDTRKTDTQKPDTRQAENKAPQKSDATYIVQVGAFSNRETATQEAGKLKALGFKAYTELVSGTMRVRVGPYTERGKADEVRRLLEKHGLHPVITAVK